MRNWNFFVGLILCNLFEVANLRHTFFRTLLLKKIEFSERMGIVCGMLLPLIPIPIILSMNLSKLFGSKCRAKILEKFVIEQAMTGNTLGFFIRELCRDINEQINSVRRELMNLEELKILKSKEENKKKFYSLNKNSPIYNELVEIFIKTYNPMEPLKEYFKGKKNLGLVTVSESIRDLGWMSSNNIVDIFIIWEIEKVEFNLFLEKTFFGRKIKYAVMSEDDFTKRLEYDDKLVLSILGQKNITFLRDRFDVAALIQEKIYWR